MANKISCRRACELVGLSRSAFAYEVAPSRWDALKELLKCIWRPSMGYRMAWALVRRVEAFKRVSVRVVHRLWRELELSVPLRRRRKFKTGAHVFPKAAGPMDVWCLDFTHETTLNGASVRVLAIKDEFTRECIALEAAGSFQAVDVARVLQVAWSERGRPKRLRSDNGPEFLAGSLQAFLETGNVEALRIKPGSPWQNGFIESFNARLRAELLDAQAFHNLLDMRMYLAIYKKYYNEERPHSALGYQTPSEFAADCWASLRATPSSTLGNGTLAYVGS